MPAPKGQTPGRRDTPGTTVCVRLDPRKECGPLDLGDEVRRHLFCPPVPVMFEGQRIGHDPAVLIDKPWCEPTTITLCREHTDAFADALDCKIPNPITIRLVPLDITRYSPVPEVRGQILLVYLPNSSQLLVRSADQRCYFEADCRGKARLSVRSPIPDRNDLSRCKEALFEFTLPLPASLEDCPGSRPASELAHNGVVLPHNKDFNVMRASAQQWPILWLSCGGLTLSDRLRPEVSVARNEIMDLTWSVRSACNLAVRRAWAQHVPPDKIVCGDIFPDSVASVVLADGLNDALITDPAMWAQEKLFLADDGRRYSVSDLRANRSKTVRLDNKPTLHEMYVSHFYITVQQILARLFLNPMYCCKDDMIVCNGQETVSIADAEKLFPPLFAIKHDGGRSAVLQHRRGAPCCRDHPFIRWLFANTLRIYQDFTGIFREFCFAVQDAHSDAGEQAEHINAMIRRVGELDSALAAPEEALLSAESFGWGRRAK